MFLPDDASVDAETNYPISEYSMADTYQEFEVEIGQTVRKGYKIIAYDAPDDPEYSFKTIEGIGVDCGFGDLLVPYRNYWTAINPMASLSAVYENGELVYKGCKYYQAQVLKKDVNGDGAVSAADVTAIYNFLLNSTDEYDYNVMYDVDGDCKVTAADITAVYNKILGQ